MRRIVIAVAALLYGIPAFAAGAFVTRTAQTPIGTIPTQYYDMSGAGVGPFLPVYVCGDGAGNVCATGGSGGGGAITAASGAYAIGALVAGTGVDGWDSTEGTKADTAYAGSGSSSVVSALKGIYNALLPASPVASRIPSAAASTNLTNPKASAGRVFKIVACNTTTNYRYIKFYNAASATVGTTSIAFSRPLPPNQCSSYDWGNIGFPFTTAISYALTQGNADSDATALAAGDVTQLSVEYQ